MYRLLSQICSVVQLYPTRTTDVTEYCATNERLN